MNLYYRVVWNINICITSFYFILITSNISALKQNLIYLIILLGIFAVVILSHAQLIWLALFTKPVLDGLIHMTSSLLAVGCVHMGDISNKLAHIFRTAAFKETVSSKE